MALNEISLTDKAAVSAEQDQTARMCSLILIYTLRQDKSMKQRIGLKIGWLVVLTFNATLTAKVISWWSVKHMGFLAFSHQY